MAVTEYDTDADEVNLAAAARSSATAILHAPTASTVHLQNASTVRKFATNLAKLTRLPRRVHGVTSIVAQSLRQPLLWPTGQ